MYYNLIRPTCIIKLVLNVAFIGIRHISVDLLTDNPRNIGISKNYQSSILQKKKKTFI